MTYIQNEEVNKTLHGITFGDDVYVLMLRGGRWVTGWHKYIWIRGRKKYFENTCGQIDGSWFCKEKADRQFEDISKEYVNFFASNDPSQGLKYGLNVFTLVVSCVFHNLKSFPLTLTVD